MEYCRVSAQVAVQKALFNINQDGAGDSAVVRAAGLKAASDGQSSSVIYPICILLCSIQCAPLMASRAEVVHSIYRI